jgi:hypothetical protein
MSARLATNGLRDRTGGRLRAARTVRHENCGRLRLSIATCDAIAMLRAASMKS